MVRSYPALHRQACTQLQMCHKAYCSSAEVCGTGAKVSTGLPVWVKRLQPLESVKSPWIGREPGESGMEVVNGAIRGRGIRGLISQQTAIQICSSYFIGASLRNPIEIVAADPGGRWQAEAASIPMVETLEATLVLLYRYSGFLLGLGCQTRSFIALVQ